MAIALLLLLALSAFFSGSESAFATASRLRAEARAQRGGFLGGIARRFLHDPPALLTTTLVGNTLALVAFATLLGLYLAAPLTAFWSDALGTEAVAGPVLISQALLATLLVLVFGEVAPKALLRAPSERVVLALALPLQAAYGLFLPVVKVAGWAAGALARLLGGPAEGVQQFLRGDFGLGLRERREAGALDPGGAEETEMLANVFELRALRVRDSMVPRIEIHAVEEAASLDAVRQRFIETGHSRLPVYREHIDQVVGVVLAHDLFHEPASLAAILRPVQAVPESKPVRDLLFSFLQRGTSLAVVIDEYGGTAGIVTIEDLLEELFGDIRDEHDPARAPMRRIDESTVVASGRVELEALEEAFGIALPEGDYDTVAGFLLDRLGNIPVEREAFDLDGYRFTVLKASANRIEAVRIMKL
ncbi:MAG TPA: hemolysin family protein [Anaeromyxobacteraceae bacterium]|nr:hemolysin family protein [Anaeromyxobacteraceae bacterium]